MNEVLAFLTAWLADLLVLGTALLAVACLVSFVLRHPATRMAVARGTLLGLAMLCVLTAVPGWPRRPLAEFTASRAGEEETDDAVAVAETGAVIPATLLIGAPLPMEESTLSAAPRARALTFAKVIKLLPLLWLAAAGLGLAYILIGGWRAFRLLRSAVKAPGWSHQELERLVAKENRSAPRLKTSERIATAVALLAWRPHILLAARSVREENKAAVRAALAHEWAHIRHGDLWLLALERLLLPVFCLHPLFWLLRRQIRIDQELLADAAAAGDAPVEYAEALMSWAKVENAAGARELGIAALSLWEHPSSLSRRVEMLLHPQSSAAGASRFWRWLAPLSLLAAVLGLSLVTLRPAAVAQENTITDTDADSQPRKPKVRKAKKEKSKKIDGYRGDAASPSAKSPSETPSTDAQVFLEMVIGQVDHATLEKAESSLGDLIQAASEDHCRLEGELIIAELSPKQYSTLTVELKETGAMEILSKPHLATIIGQEATVQIGSQIPLVRVEGTVRGESVRAVEFKEVGQKISIRPTLSEKDPSLLSLVIAAEHSELDKRAKLNTGDDTPRFITSTIKVEVEAALGKTLVITEREPKKGSGRTKSILLAVVPLKILPVPVPAPVPAPAASFRKTHVKGEPSADLERLRDENASLRKQVDEMRTRMIDLEVHVRWLREAAAPGADGKVSDAEFLRRVYLDLTGLVPTAEESQTFLNDKDLGKRDKLIDSVLARQKAVKDLTGYGSKGWLAKFIEESYWQKRKAQIAADPEANPTTIKPAPDHPADEVKAADTLQIFRLTRSSADNVAAMLAKVFPKAEGLSVAVEERTNSLIIRGTPETLEKVRALLEVLDREDDPKEDAKEPAKAPAQEKGAFLRELNEADLQAAQAALQAAKANFERFHILRKEDVVSDQQLERARQQLLLAELRVEATKGVETVKLRELELQMAEADLQSAVLTQESAERLTAKGFLSKIQLEGAQASVEQKKAKVNEAKAKLNAIRAKE